MRTRSPRPERPASVSARAPLARPKRVISAKPREISAARAFWPSRAALDHAAGDGEHVLDRAADLGAGDVVGQIGPEAGPGDARRPAARRAPGPRPPGSPRSAGRRRPRGRRSGRRGRRSASPAEPRCATSCISRPVASSIPLAQSTSGLPAAARPPSTARKCCAGRNDEEGFASAEIGEIAGRADRLGAASRP